MSKVIADISMSLDGYITAPGVDSEHGLGLGGDAIHAWVLEEPRSRSTKQCPHCWNNEGGYGHDQNQSAAPPC